MVSSLSPFLYTLIKALSMFELTPALKGLYAAGVESLKAAFNRLFDNLLAVTSSDVALEVTKAVSQSQSPLVPLKP